MLRIGGISVLYNEKIYYHLGRSFKDSEALEFLNQKISKFPYDYLKKVRFANESYVEFNQGATIDYRINPEVSRDVTVILKVNDGYQDKKIIMEIRHHGNEVKIITKTPHEDTSVFHINYFRNYGMDTINLLSKKVRFHNTDREETISSVFSQFDSEGNLLNYKEKDHLKSNEQNRVYKKTYNYNR